MLLKQIQYFLSVVDNNSFTEAAEECFISQSAISQQIKILEAELGVELLKRHNRGFSITPAGEYFYQQGKHIVDKIAKIKQETLRIGKAENPHLKIGYLHCYGSQELSQAINKFTTKHPEISLDLLTGTHESLYELLRTGKVDMVLNDQRRALSSAYVNYHLITAKCFVEISPLNPLSKKAKLTLKDLQTTPCILIATPEQKDQEREYYQNTFGLGNTYLFANNIDEGRLMVVGNRGFMLTESSSAKISISNNTVCIPLYRDAKQITTKYFAFWLKEHGNYLIEEFASILNAIFKKK